MNRTGSFADPASARTYQWTGACRMLGPVLGHRAGDGPLVAQRMAGPG